MRRHLTSIVAIDRNGAIGCKNHLPWQLKSDLAFFRKTTLGHSVVMGRKTFDSIGGCLKGRSNLILTKRASLYDGTENCQFFHTPYEALDVALHKNEDETFVIGGASTYSLFCEFVDRYIVTIVDCEASEPDAFLSEGIINMFSNWQKETIMEISASPGRDDHSFRVVSYTSPRSQEMSKLRLEQVQKRMDRLVKPASNRHHLKSVYSI
jgi:dihydrofolate reductase